MADESLKLAIELESLLHKYNTSTNPSANSSLTEPSSKLWQSILQKKGRYKDLTGRVFATVQDTNDEEREKLAHFFALLRGPQWRSKTGWIPIEQSTPTPAPYLHGISTIPSPLNAQISTVSAIHLARLGCMGDLASLPLSFSNCSELNLKFNRIFASLPPSFSQMGSLQVIDISNNALCFDVALCDISSLKLLRYFDLSYNKLFGSFSATMFQNNTALESVDFSGNHLSGNLPHLFSSYLTSVRFASNQFSGIIPADWAQLVSLETLDLSQNLLTGEVYVITSLTQLKHLHLEHNNFSGEIPHMISVLSELETLYLQNNALTGGIPDALCEIVSLRRLDLAKNRLCYCIPFNIGRLSNLETLNLSGNSFIPILPESLSELTRLHFFMSCSSEGADVSSQFDLEKFQKLCRLHKETGVDSFTTTYEALYGSAVNLPMLEEDRQWKSSFGCAEDRS